MACTRQKTCIHVRHEKTAPPAEPVPSLLAESYDIARRPNTPNEVLRQAKRVEICRDIVIELLLMQQERASRGEPDEHVITDNDQNNAFSMDYIYK